MIRPTKNQHFFSLTAKKADLRNLIVDRISPPHGADAVAGKLGHSKAARDGQSMRIPWDGHPMSSHYP